MNTSITKTSRADKLKDEIYDKIKAHPKNKKVDKKTNEKILEMRSYPKSFVRFMGSNDGAVFLSLLIYWSDAEWDGKRSDGYFYKSVKEWMDDADLSRRKVDFLRDFLKGKGILEMAKYRVHRNLKEQWFYRLNRERFSEVFEEFLDGNNGFPQGDDYSELDDEIVGDASDHDTPRPGDNFEDDDLDWTQPVTVNQEETGFTVGASEHPGSMNEQTGMPEREVQMNQMNDPVNQTDNPECANELNNNNEINNKLKTISYNNEPHQQTTSILGTRMQPRKNFATAYDEKPIWEVDFEETEDEVGDEADRDTGGDSMEDAIDACKALRSVGAYTCDITFLRDQTRSIEGFHEDLDLLAYYSPECPTLLERALQKNETEMLSFIVRPRGGALIQVDDCDEATVNTLFPYCFMAIETSLGNFQVWLALPEDTTDEERLETRKRLLKKLGGDVEASGAMRFAGSINWKPGRNRFRVRLDVLEEGNFTSTEELEDAGLLAEEEADRRVSLKSDTKGFKAKLPDYQKCLEAKNGDRSDADASFLALCKLRGFTRDEAEAALMEVSERASEGGPRVSNRYVGRTADFVFGNE